MQYLKSTLILLLFTFLLQGCVAVALGGAAAGGYFIGKDQRPVKQIAEDAGISASVKAALLADSKVHGLSINVDTYLSVVTLHGRVNTHLEEVRAVGIASRVDGVKDVVTKLSVSRVPVEERS